MSDLVCLNCGREMPYDWAPCPHCGWKPPQSWEGEQGEKEIDQTMPASKRGSLSKPRPWIQWTTWILLALGLAGLLVWLFHK